VENFKILGDGSIAVMNGDGPDEIYHPWPCVNCQNAPLSVAGYPAPRSASAWINDPAWAEWRERIPVEARGVAMAYGAQSWYVLRLLCFGGRWAFELAKTNRGLTCLVCYWVEQLGNTSTEGYRAIATVPTSAQLQVLGLPVRPLVVKFLTRCEAPGDLGQWGRVVTAALSRTDGVLKVLAGIPRLNMNVLCAAAWLPRQVVTFALLSTLQDWEGGYSVVQRMVEQVRALGCQRWPFGQLDRPEQFLAAYQRLSSRCADLAYRNVRIEPPIAPRVGMTPLRTVSEIFSEAREMNNCAASFSASFVEKRVYFYALQNPRYTVQITRFGVDPTSRWHLTACVGFDNGQPAESTKEWLLRWLDEAQLNLPEVDDEPIW
jgi:hypothetical protein